MRDFQILPELRSGRGTAPRSGVVEGLCGGMLESPSTTLRVVPLPKTSLGRICW